MRNFIVLKNRENLGVVHASGNLKALLETANITGFPDFPIHVHEGLLSAKIESDHYMVFDCTDGHAHDLALSVLEKTTQKIKQVKKQSVALRLPKLLSLPKLSALPELPTGEPAYVV